MRTRIKKKRKGKRKRTGHDREPAQKEVMGGVMEQPTPSAGP
jgi:hypothetical protein